MSKIDYGRLMHDALRQLMASVLERVAADGLPGDHHFYITFDTGHPGVDIAEWLMERYPEEMTIVIQNWFDNLTVQPDHFTITLNFGNNPEPLVIPFDAVKTFVDPSVEFGLRFDPSEEELEEEFFDDDLDMAEDDDTPQKPEGSAEVVSLDTFRKN
jgi:hypothetical protein